MMASKGNDAVLQRPPIASNSLDSAAQAIAVVAIEGTMQLASLEGSLERGRGG